MFAQSFYHRTIRKYVTYFGTLFNDIYISRSDGTETSNAVTNATLRVPITYGPKQKTLARLDADPNLNRPAAIVLPRMSFELTGIDYDPSRKLTTVNKGYVSGNTQTNSRLTYVYNPVPYDLNFTLSIMVKNAEDGTKILEQILPYFTPDWTATLNLIPQLDVKLDIPVIIQRATSEDSYEGGIDERRLITWSLDFVMKGYLFGPIKKSKVITLANVNFFTTLDQTSDPEERITIKPGLTANGEPTSNAQASVDRNEISSNSNYGYIINYGPIE